MKHPKVVITDNRQAYYHKLHSLPVLFNKYLERRLRELLNTFNKTA